MSVDFKNEYVREKRTGVWHIVWEGPKALCGRKISFDAERSWPGFNMKRCASCAERKRARA